MPVRTITRVIAAAVIGMVVVVYLTTLRAGHDWGDDFSLYVLHARNLARGLPYAATGFIYNPVYPEITFAEPPLTPLLLAPVVWMWGLNLHAMQVLMVGTFAGALAMIFLSFESALQPASRIGLLIALGFNWFFWSFKENILADYPFLLVTFGALAIIDRLYSSGFRSRREALAGIVAGGAIYVTYATRSIGAELLAATLLFDFVVSRRFTVFQAVVVTTFATGAVWQGFLLRAPVNYDMAYFGARLSLTANLPAYLRSFETLWTNGVQTRLGLGLFALASGAAGVGLFERLRRPSVLDAFALAYPLGAIAWDAGLPEFRLLYPMIPFFGFYAFKGVEALASRATQRTRVAAAVMLTLAICSGYVRERNQWRTGSLPGVTDPTSGQLFDFVRQTPGSSVFIFRKPRALTLFTERAASVYDVLQSGQDLADYCRQIHATHLISSSMFLQDADILDPFIDRHRNQLRLAFRNHDFRVYEIVADLRH
jgi:hypothetical protein